MLEKWKSALDKEDNICVLFLDFSKVFDTINHDLSVVKSKGYGFSINPLDLTFSYLKNQNKSVQINNYFSLAKKCMTAFSRVSLMNLLYLIYL